jgi:hypothetical protein
MILPPCPVTGEMQRREFRSQKAKLGFFLLSRQPITVPDHHVFLRECFEGNTRILVLVRLTVEAALSRD